MRSAGKSVVLLLAGFAAGVAFIVACGTSNAPSGFGPTNAAAQANCSKYDVQIMDMSSTTGKIDTLPAGWIPFGIAAGSGHVVAFRCSP